MTEPNAGFKDRAAAAAQDPEVIAKFRMVAERQAALRKFRLAALGTYEQLRDRLNAAKEEVLRDHETFIAALTEKVQAQGGHVHRAADAAEARRIICAIAAAAGARVAVKGKSMTSEEINLSPALEQQGLEVFETDLGEFIIQLAHEKPSHIVTPAIHKNRRDIGRLFADKLGLEYTEDPNALTMKARAVLREQFLRADLGITGANALIAENGTVVLLENEGNIRLSTTLPRVHVALAGIDKILPRLSDLGPFLKLLPLSATGQKLSGYVSFIRGPARPDERDGAREFHLVLLDNGRSKVRRDPILREALKCIRCGACLNNCPVYQHIGGHAYGSVYPGPIGAMITRALASGDEGFLLPFASSLCGACAEVCPARIPIPEILIALRERAVAGVRPGAAGSWPAGPSFAPVAERIAFRVWGELWSRPSTYRATTDLAALAGHLWPRATISSLPPPGEAWTRERDFPAPAPLPFHSRWRMLKPLLDSLSLKARATSGASSDAPATSEVRAASAAAPGDLDQFIAEASQMKVEVHRARDAAEVRNLVAQVLGAYHGQSLVRWDHPLLDALELDPVIAAAGLTVTELPPTASPDNTLKAPAAAAAVGLTGADFALADTGSIVLLTGPGHERSLSLLPPVHLAILRAGSILNSIDDLLLRLGRIPDPDFRGLTIISAPSLTGDIEMVPVFGVHGPGKLIVIVVS
jgi:L-lactate dehydrogenase complex protein LldF